MNANKRVLLFVVYSVGLFLIFSVSAIAFHWSWTPFNRVNLVSELIHETDIAESDNSAADSVVVADSLPASLPQPLFELYNRPHLITHFYSDTQRSSLPGLAAKLQQLKQTGKGKVRIAYLGDSMIEGDLMTQTLRELLQNYFGGQGVGFVPITSQVNFFRKSVAAVFSKGWEDQHFRNGGGARLHLSGHLFRTANDWVTMTDHTLREPVPALEKSLLCGPYGKEININVNGNRYPIFPQKPFNRVLLAHDSNSKIALGVAAPQLPVYGISIESENGVFVDNFSFRGITGIELAGLDSAFLRSIAEENPYDLIVLQYGVNLLYRPKETDFDWYGRAMVPILEKLQRCFAPAELVVVSTADRAFRQGGKYQTAIGLDSLVQTQAKAARDAGALFYNQFTSMGGTNSIVEWAKAKPSLANKDHVHPNGRGSEILARYFFEAILKEYQKIISHPQ
jgi:lysophospholipase L1-like esterase